MPPTESSNEDHPPVPHVVKIPCKLIFGIMLHDLGLPDARYISHTHEDGEVSAIVTYYGPSEIPGKLFQQFKIGGAPATDFETAEDSAARESIRHIETTEDVEVEDLRYGELKGVMKSYKALLLRSIKEKRAIQTHSVSRYPPK
jgi:hypothetical protein